ncbi:MAG: hypothetical protein JXO72_03085 [Vicinamibacteria bacterium]|nr:hypothetical protein [Vicinamibacteria bacterium]
MKRGTWVLMIVMPWIAACSGGKDSGSGEVRNGRKNQDSHLILVEHDKRVMSKASAAVNEVVRGIPDCEAVNAALPEAEREIEQAQRRVRTSVGRQMLEAMQHQLRKARTFCP